MEGLLRDCAATSTSKTWDFQATHRIVIYKRIPQTREISSSSRVFFTLLTFPCCLRRESDIIGRSCSVRNTAGASAGSCSGCVPLLAQWGRRESTEVSVISTLSRFSRLACLACVGAGSVGNAIFVLDLSEGEFEQT